MPGIVIGQILYDKVNARADIITGVRHSNKLGPWVSEVRFARTGDCWRHQSEVSQSRRYLNPNPNERDRYND